jgi:flagellar assembly protein FliH
MTMSDPLITTLTLVNAIDTRRSFVPWGQDATPSPETSPDPIAAAYAEGWDAGRQGSIEALEEERAALAQLARCFAEPKPETPNHLAELIATTVERLVTYIVGKAPIDRDDLTKRALAAAALVTASDKATAMHLHPDDIALLCDIDVGLALTPDPDMARGGLRIVCAAGSIEDDRTSRLSALRDALGVGEALS